MAFEIIDSFPNNKHRIKTDINTIKNYIYNWKYNRLSDNNRIEKIKQYILNSNSYCLD